MLSLQRFFGFFASVCLILAFLPFTSAGKHTLPLQKVVDYYTYRSVVAAFGPSQEKMLKGLAGKGTHKDGGANFLEFENLVSPEKKQLTVGDYNAAGITDLDNPGVYEVSDFVKTQNKIAITRKGLYFDDWSLSFVQVVEKTCEVLETANKKMREDNKKDLQLSYNFKIQTALQDIVLLRNSEMISNDEKTKGLVEFLEKKFPGIDVQLDETPWGHDPSVKIYSLNAAETVKQTPTPFVSFTEADLKEILDEYGNVGSPKDPAVAHQKVASVYSHFHNIVLMKCNLP